MKAVAKEVLVKPVVAYAHARKGMHICVVLSIFMMELALTMLIHDVVIHMFAISSVSFWELLVTSLGENG